MIKNTFGSANKEIPQDNLPPSPFRNKEEVISFIKKDFEQRRIDRRPFEMQWVLNMNFLNGNQHCDINPNTLQVFQNDRMYDWEEREIFNKLSSIYEARLSKLKQVKPMPFVRPFTQEPKDLATAKTSKAILKGLDSAQEMTIKRGLLTAWSEISGCAFIKHRFDKKLGGYIGSDETGEIYEGDVGKDVLTSFEIYPDSNFANGIDGCKSIIHARAYKVEDIFEDWGVTVMGRDVDTFTLTQTIGAGGLGYNSSVYKFGSTASKNSEIVIEYMRLPCKKYPNGLHIIISANELLFYGDFIYKVGEDGKPGFPISMQSCIDNPGFFWPNCIMTRLIPIQRSYNKNKNRKQELLNRKAIGILDVEDDGNLDVEDLEEEGLYPGKVLTHPRGGKPASFLRSTDSATDFENEERRLEDEFFSISGVSPFASQSTPPSGIVAGTALEAIKEADDSRISLTIEGINNAAIKGYKIDLRLYKQFSTGQRVLRYVGKNNDVDMIEWMASDLTSDDIIIEKDSEISQTPAQRKQTAMEMLQYGLFDESKVTPKVRNKFLKTYEFGNWEDIDDIDELQVNNARRENMMLKKGVPPQIKPYHNHEIHILEHDRLRLETDYGELEQQNPDIVAAFDIHVQEHEQIVQQRMQAMAQAANPQKAPSESIPYKDLPPIGQIQMAAQSKIQLTPQDIMQQEATKAAEKAAEQAAKSKPIQTKVQQTA